MSVYYVVRYLEPGMVGKGEIVHAFGQGVIIMDTGKHIECEDPTIEAVKMFNPKVFEKPGFYSLMKSTGDVLNVKAE